MTAPALDGGGVSKTLPGREGAGPGQPPPDAGRDPRAARRERRRQVHADQDPHRRPPCRTRGREPLSASRSVSRARATRCRPASARSTRSATSITRFSVGENIMLERLAGPPRPRRLRPRRRRGRGAGSSSSTSTVDPRTPVSRLSVAQMQLVEIAKALSLEARVLLLDEPTASITPHEAAGPVPPPAPARAARASRSCSSATSSRRCSRSATTSPCCATAATPARAKPLAGPHPARARPPDGRPRRGRVAPRRPPAGPPGAVRRCELRGRGDRVRAPGRVASSLRRGEILGLYGLVGAGRSELAKALLGLGAITAGTVRSAAARPGSASPGEALRRCAHRLRQRGPQGRGPDPAAHASPQRRDHRLAPARPAARHRQRPRRAPHSPTRSSRASRSARPRCVSPSASSPAATSRRSAWPSGSPPRSTS